MAEHMRPLGLVQSPKPDGINGTFLTVIQPASGPTLKEREKTYGEPTDEAKIRCNLGIAYVSQEIGRRRSRSTQMLIVMDETGGRATGQYRLDKKRRSRYEILFTLLIEYDVISKE